MFLRKLAGSYNVATRRFLTPSSGPSILSISHCSSLNLIVSRLKSTESQAFALEDGAVTSAYDELVSSQKIKDDPAQRTALEYLDRLHDEVLEFDKVREDYVESLESKEKQPDEEKEQGFSLFSSLFKTEERDTQKQQHQQTSAQDEYVCPRGLYLYGGPGSGKTFTMELFHKVLPIEGKRRVHFHEFMLNVHRMLHTFQKHGYRSDEMVDKCVEALYNEGWVLCFDEFQITDIADAMIIRRLFDALLARGMVIVITSNREPGGLYKNGIQRDLFLPFIEDLKTKFDVVNVQSEVDYRMLVINEAGAASKNEDSSVFFVNKARAGLGEAAKFERLFEKLSKKDVVYNSTLTVQGRHIKIPVAARNTDVARFTFDDICGGPVGAADYYAIASTFHTIFIDQIPQIKLNMLNQLRRFITMIDTFYDQKVVLITNAAVPMDELLDRQGVETEDDVQKVMLQEVDIIGDATYVPSRSNIDEVFAFDRTLSRLHEMQREDYLLQSRKRTEAGPSPVRFLSQFEHLSSGDIKMLWERYDKNMDGIIDKHELKKMLEEITLFRSGHRHVPEEVFEETKSALTCQDSNKIEWKAFESYFKNFGIVVRG